MLLRNSKRRVAILISGRGSNMEALIKAASDQNYPAEICGVISNLPDALGLQHAERLGMPTQVIESRRYGSRASFEEQVHSQLVKWGAELVCLAGFMRIISPYLIDKWQDKILNIHPSMLPNYPGLNVHDRVFAAGETFSGCTVHYVREKVDFGPGVVQARVPLVGCKSAEEVAQRILPFEHLIYPLAVRLYCGDKIEVIDEKVYFKGSSDRLDGLSDGAFNPLIVIDLQFRNQVTQRMSRYSDQINPDQGFKAVVGDIKTSDAQQFGRTH